MSNRRYLKQKSKYELGNPRVEKYGETTIWSRAFLPKNRSAKRFSKRIQAEFMNDYKLQDTESDKTIVTH